ncbi:hypothetical protein NL489_29685, partial [Klebsiella pneumoniae]|nr:hypothetical protein [Klebsiella pneumoniae]
DELITAVHIAAQPAGSACSFVKSSSLSANDWPCASAAVLISRREVHIGLGALAPVPHYVSFNAAGMRGEEVVEAALDAIT